MLTTANTYFFLPPSLSFYPFLSSFSLSLPLPLPSPSLFSLLPLSPLTATVLAVVGVFLSHSLALVNPRDKVTLLGYLPPALFVMTMLLTILQPEFNLKEVCVSPQRTHKAK